VLKHLEQARKSRVLQLRSCQLKTVPEAIAEVSTLLRSLDLSVNRISTLPVSIGDFLNLKQLHLDDNKLKALPDEIGHLRKLETLSVAGNALESLPDTLIGCSALKHVDVSRNSLVVFPLPLCYLPELDTLNMTANAITAIPDEVHGVRCDHVLEHVADRRVEGVRVESQRESLARAQRSPGAMRPSADSPSRGELPGQGAIQSGAAGELAVDTHRIRRESVSRQGLSIAARIRGRCNGIAFITGDFQAYQERYTATKRKIF
jgi:hypothetical protein